MHYLRLFLISFLLCTNLYPCQVKIAEKLLSRNPQQQLLSFVNVLTPSISSALTQLGQKDIKSKTIIVPFGQSGEIGKAATLAQNIEVEGAEIVEKAIANSAGQNAVGRISLSTLHHSIGNIEKLEKAVNMFKNVPSAITENGPLTKLLECAKDMSKLSTARGAAFELEVAYDLANAGEEILEFGKKIKNDFATKEFDIITNKRIIECKNIDWATKVGKAAEILQNQISQQSAIAKDVGRKYELFTRGPLSQSWIDWFEKKGIKVVEVK